MHRRPLQSRSAFAASLASALAFSVAGGCSHASNSSSALEDAASGPPDVWICADEVCPSQDAASDISVDTGWACAVIPQSNAGSTCDACVQASCGALWCTCAQPALVPDAGPSACLEALACLTSGAQDGGDVEASAEAGSAEAGTDAGCSYAASAVQSAQALLSCVEQSCAAECPAPITLGI